MQIKIMDKIKKSSSQKKGLIIVKFMARGLVSGASLDFWTRQLPGKKPEWGNCRFDFDTNARTYDWLVVYHDIPRQKWKHGEEKLFCPRERTILLTTEPSTITVYGSDYLKQFGHILTFQEPWAIPHPHPIFTQPGLPWFYGNPVDGEFITYDQLKAAPLPEKTKIISTVCSSRNGKLTLHFKRADFTRQLQEALPELVVFGHGVNPMNDKAEALDPFKYHLSVENHVFRHCMTEKLPDTFLGFALPFYHGCPNATDYFSSESFIPIDINNFDRTLDIIQSTIRNNEYQDRLPYIIEARNRVLDEHNMFAVLDREISARQHERIENPTLNKVIRNRQTMRIKNPLAGIRSLIQAVLVKSRHKLGLT